MTTKEEEIECLIISIYAIVRSRHESIFLCDYTSIRICKSVWVSKQIKEKKKKKHTKNSND